MLTMVVCFQCPLLLKDITKTVSQFTYSCEQITIRHKMEDTRGKHPLLTHLGVQMLWFKERLGKIDPSDVARELLESFTQCTLCKGKKHTP